jgi:hypothetical protein
MAILVGLLLGSTCSGVAQQKFSVPSKNQWNANGEEPSIVAEGHSAYVQFIDDSRAIVPNELWYIYRPVAKDDAELLIFVKNKAHELVAFTKDGRKAIHIREESTAATWKAFMRVYDAAQHKIGSSSSPTEYAATSTVRVEDFNALKDQLYGKNAETRLSLPLWIGRDARMIFPPGKTAKPSEIVTITAVLLCRDYPAPESCGVEGDVLVLLLDGAQPRPRKPDGALFNSSNSTDNVVTTLNTLSCMLGTAFDCALARQDNRAIEQRQTSDRAANSAAEQVQLEQERRYNESGPEIAILLSSLQQDADGLIKNRTILDFVGKYLTIKTE